MEKRFDNFHLSPAEIIEATKDVTESPPGPYSRYGKIIDPEEIGLVQTRRGLRRMVVRPRRNEKCPCESGKKFKNCCINK